MAHTGFVYHPDYLNHVMGLHHPESPERLRAILTRLEASGSMTQLVRLEPTPPDQEWIASWITKVHTSTYLKDLLRLSTGMCIMATAPSERSMKTPQCFSSAPISTPTIQERGSQMKQAQAGAADTPRMSHYPRGWGTRNIFKSSIQSCGRHSKPIVPRRLLCRPVSTPIETILWPA